MTLFLLQVQGVSKVSLKWETSPKPQFIRGNSSTFKIVLFCAFMFSCCRKEMPNAFVHKKAKQTSINKILFS